jgi:hypothetical protein
MESRNDPYAMSGVRSTVRIGQACHECLLVILLQDNQTWSILEYRKTIVN